MTSSTDLKSISDIAKQITNSPAEQLFSSTKSGGAMTTTQLSPLAIQKLTERTPEENTKAAIRWLQDTHKLPITLVTSSRFTEYGTEFDTVCDTSKLTDEQKRQARDVLQKLDCPLPRLEIVKLMTRLSVITTGKKQEDLEALIAIWVEELSNYPADIVANALKSKFKWFPTLAEVLDICDNEVAKRNLIKRGLW